MDECERVRLIAKACRRYTDDQISMLAGTVAEAIEELGSMIVPIQAKPVQLIAVKRNTYGNPVGPEWSDYFDTNCVEISGTRSATNLGEYEISATPNPGCAWEDGSTEPMTFKLYLVEDIIPSVQKQTDRYYSSSKWEHGEEQGWDIFSETGADGKYGPDVLKCDIRQTSSYGTFPVSWSLQNSENEIRYVWYDGTVAPKIGSINIEQYIIPKVPEQAQPMP